jgi:geranylgeranyl diphosphate synthase type II
MYTFDQIARMAAEAVEELRLPAEPALLYDPIRYTLSGGGKRIRPILTLSSCALFSDEVQKSLPAALAIEVFHNFTLLHDDLMDNSSLRRGRETVHVRWNNDVAILSGDAMLVYAYELAAQSDPDKIPQLLAILNRIFVGVCQGQQYDMDFEQVDTVTADQYLHMIGLKTAVLMAGAMQAGAWLGGADEALAEQVYEAGMHLGMAFQLQDDWLDTFGDTQTLGKNTGDDIASNKKTFLLIKARELASPTQREELDGLMRSTDLSREEKTERVKALYVSSGAKALTEKLIDDYFNDFSRLLDQIRIDEPRKQPLREVARKLIGREK